MRGEIEKLKHMMEVIDYLIIKRLSGIRKLKYLIYIRERNIEKLKVSLRYKTYVPRISHLCLKFFKSNRNQIHILYVSDREWLIQNSSTWSSSQWQIRKKKVLRNTLHFSFFSPCFLGGAWRVSKTRQIASPCKQEITQKLRRNHRIDPLLYITRVIESKDKS